MRPQSLRLSVSPSLRLSASSSAEAFLLFSSAPPVCLTGRRLRCDGGPGGRQGKAYGFNTPGSPGSPGVPGVPGASLTAAEPFFFDDLWSRGSFQRCQKQPLCSTLPFPQLSVHSLLPAIHAILLSVSLTLDPALVVMSSTAPRGCVSPQDGSSAPLTCTTKQR